jgi:hypothetical protein
MPAWSREPGQVRQFGALATPIAMPEQSTMGEAGQAASIASLVVLALLSPSDARIYRESPLVAQSMLRGRHADIAQ